MVLGSLWVLCVYPVSAGQLATLPYSNARAYRQPPQMVWRTVQEVVEAWGLESVIRDEASQATVSEWKRFSDFAGSPFFRSVPTFDVDGAQLVPVDFQLHVFVSPFVEPTRIHVTAAVRTEREQDRYVHHGVGFVSTEFFRELEARLGRTGVTIPVDGARGDNPCLGDEGRGNASASTGAVDLSPVRRLIDFEFFHPAVESEALVILDVTIRFDGSVVASRVVSVNGTDLTEPELFARAAQNIVSLWRYRPAERDDCPVSVAATVAMSFGLDGSRPLFFSQTLSEHEAGTGSEPVSTVYEPGAPGLRNPRLLDETQPVYTREATSRGIQGEVWLEAVVLPDGTVGDVQVTKSLDMKFGLDVAAVIAAKQWRFDPGTLDGEPVAVKVGIALEFDLRSP